MDTPYTKGFKAGYDFGYKDAANENRYNTGVKVGIAFEQDRIIEILKDEMQHDPDVIECHCGSWIEAIELIKGKN